MGALREACGFGRATVLAVALVGVLAAPASADTGYSRPAQYGTHLVKDVSVKMSDGVVLEADVYYPSDPSTGAPAAGKFPVVLAQTPYGKRSATTTQSFGDYGGDGYFPYLVKRGYINAIVDVRGTGSSQGDFGLFSKRDARDGVELVRWAAGLERSSGKVGAAGYSYVGLNQIYTAAAVGRRSPLKAIVPSAAGIDLYRDLAFGGGMPNAVFAGGLERPALDDAHRAARRPGQGPVGTLLGRAERAKGFAELDAGLYTEIEQGGPRAYDSAFWRERSPAGEAEARGAQPRAGADDHRLVRRLPARRAAQLHGAAERVGGAAAVRPDARAASEPRRATRSSRAPGSTTRRGWGSGSAQIHLEWFDRWLRGSARG